MIKIKLLYILENYLINSKSIFRNNELAKKIRNDFRTSFASVLNNNQIIVKGSCGQSQWATIPWFAFLYSKLTSTMQHGCYVVYLFEANMKGVYLSLNQGWKSFEDTYGIKEAKNQIAKKAELYQESLKKNFDTSNFDKQEFSFSPIKLNNINSKTSLPEGYELGHILGKYYSKEIIYSMDDKDFLNDLKELIDIYIQCVDKQLFHSNDDAQSGVNNMISDVESLNNDKKLTETDRKYLIDARLGQGKFRRELMKLYPECPLSKIKLKSLLRASHIKPWKNSNNIERLDKFNGFMLAVHVDALFDSGYISFNDDGSLLISHFCKNDIDKFNINKDIKIKIHDESKNYLLWHRTYIFKK